MTKKISTIKLFSQIRAALFILSFTTLAGCALGHQTDPYYNNVSTNEPIVGLNVIIKPERHYPLNHKKALLIPFQMADSREDRWEKALTRIAHSILLQERIFAVIELYDNDNTPVSKIFDEAYDRGFDYVITGVVPHILVPSGNTAGWVGLNLKINGAGMEKRYTLWHLYGGAELRPEATRHDLMGSYAAKSAPSVTSGFFSLVRSMARLLKQG